MSGVFRIRQNQERKQASLDHVKDHSIIDREDNPEIREFIANMQKALQVQQKYIENVPDNIHQSVEECCRDKILPGINDYTHNEVTSMYYHIQTNMSDEYKKQTRKLEHLLMEKLNQSQEEEHKLLVDAVNTVMNQMEEERSRTHKILLINTVISAAGLLTAIVCVVTFILLQIH